MDVGRRKRLFDLKASSKLGEELELYRKRLEGKTVGIRAVQDCTVPLLWLLSVDLGMVPFYVGITYFDGYLQRGLREIQERLGRTDLKIIVNPSKFEDEVLVSQAAKPDVFICF